MRDAWLCARVWRHAELAFSLGGACGAFPGWRVGPRYSRGVFQWCSWLIELEFADLSRRSPGYLSLAVSRGICCRLLTWAERGLVFPEIMGFSPDAEFPLSVLHEAEIGSSGVFDGSLKLLPLKHGAKRLTLRLIADKRRIPFAQGTHFGKKHGWITGHSLQCLRVRQCSWRGF